MAERNLQVVVTAIDQASDVLKSIGEKSKALGKDISSTGLAMVKIGAAPTAALAFAAKTAIDFESAFAGVRKTVNATEAEFKAISDNFREISKVTPVAVNELSRIGELAGQLGVSGVDNITKFTKTIADIAVTTNLTTESAATEFARLINIMGESLDNVDRIGSAIVDLGNNFATTEAEISSFALNMAGAGKIAGLATSDVLGIGAAMSSVGVEAQVGGTAVQKVLIGMTKAANEGGEELGAFAETAGVSAEEFTQLWEQDAAKAFTQFVEGLGKQGDDAFTTLETLGLADQRLIKAFLSLANAGDLLGRSIDMSSQGWENNTALAEEARKRYETTESQIMIARNALADIAKVIGDALLPRITGMIKALAPAVQKFAEFAEAHPNLITGLLAIGAAIGAIGAVLIPLGILISSAGTVFMALGAAVGAISAPMLIVAGVIAAVVAAVVLLKKAWDSNLGGIQDKVSLVFGKISQTFESLKKSLSIFYGDNIGFNFIDSSAIGILGGAVKIITNLGEAFGHLREFFISGDLTGEMLRFFNIHEDSTIAGFLVDTRNGFIELGNKIKSFAVGAGEAFTAFLNVIKPITDWISAFLVPLWEASFGLMGAVLRLQIDTWTILFKSIIWALTEIVNYLVGVLQPIWETITAYLGERITAMQATITANLNLIRAIWDTVTAFMGERIAAVQATITANVDLIRAVLQAMIDWLQKTLSPIFAKIWEGLTQVITGAIDKWVERFNFVKGIVEGVINTFTTLINKAREAAEVAAGKLDVQSFQDGGFVPRTGLSLLHKGEFVASRDMLEGRKSVPSSVEQVFNQPINIQVNGGDGQDMQLMGDRLAYSLRNSR